MNLRRILAVPLMAGAILAAGAGTAAAHTANAQTITVYWITPHSVTGPPPTDASNAGWPQTYLKSLPTCHTPAYWVQVDEWLADTAAHKATDAKIIAGGVLTYDAGKGYSADHSVIVSWHFVLVPACATATPTSTPTKTTPSATSTPTTPKATPTPTVPQSTPTPPASTPKTTPPPVAKSSIPPATSTEAPPVLAQTGTDHLGDLIQGGVGILVAGIVALYLAYRRKKGQRA